MLKNSVVLFLLFLPFLGWPTNLSRTCPNSELRAGCHGKLPGCWAEEGAGQPHWALKEDSAVVCRLWALGPALPLASVTLKETP